MEPVTSVRLDWEVKSPQPSKCLFCTSEEFKNTKEHFLRQHLAGQIPHLPGVTRRQATPEGGYRTWKVAGSPFLTQVVKGVCGVCNSGWMEALDSSLDSIIVGLAAGESLRIDEDARHRLLRWARKYAVCHEQQMKGEKFFDERRRAHLVDPDNTPENACLWVIRTPAYEKVFDRMFTVTFNIKEKQPRAIVSTLGMGRVAFLYLEYEGTFPALKFASHLTQQAQDRGVGIVWPHRAPLSMQLPPQEEVPHEFVWYLSGGAQLQGLFGPRHRQGPARDFGAEAENG